MNGPALAGPREKPITVVPIAFRVDRHNWRRGLPVYVGRLSTSDVGEPLRPAGAYLRVGRRCYGLAVIVGPFKRATGPWGPS